MNLDDKMQRIIFRPVAVQRYIQGHNDELVLPHIASPKTVWCYAAIIAFIAIACWVLKALWSHLS